MSYGWTARLANTTFDDAVERVTAVLKEHGFGVLTTIDVKATLKQKIDVDFRPYTILGACNPQLAHRALRLERELGLLLPCNVVVQTTDDGAVEVNVIDPGAMFQVVENPEMGDVARDAEALLRRVVEALSTPVTGSGEGTPDPR
jgi:uncharacterized protein (DUF302 family)